MNRIRVSTSLLMLLSGMAVQAQVPAGVCPTQAVFLALTDYTTGISEVRGYPTRGNGPTAPCQIMQGPLTTLTTANGISISVHGYLHVLQFLTNGTIAVFPGASHGNVAPSRIESVLNNDLVAVATDAQANDFALSRRDGVAAISVTAAETTRAEHSFIAPGFSLESGSLAIDGDNNLVVGGYDPSGNPLIETMGTSVSLGAPKVVRQLAGAKTGIFPGSFADYSSNTISLAADPITGELYVYNFSYANQQQQVSVFPPHASGDVAPNRVIAGPLTLIGPPGELNNKIAVSADGRLFVAEANDRTLVFAPGAAGNIAPAQIIQDSTIGKAAISQGGIGVRSCECQ
jgi:hypothetical protein